MERRRWALPLGLVLALSLPLLVLISTSVGTERETPERVLRAVLASLGLAEPLPEPDQTILLLRLWRALTAAGVGAALAYSGALLQGLFRNPLAAPSLIGVTGGASLGATLAILYLGGWGASVYASHGFALGALLVPTAAFLGAAGTVAVVAFLAAPKGRLSTSTLLLFGIAVNMCVAGLFAAIQSFALRDWEVSRAILSWSFGSLEDRSALHAATIAAALLLSAAAIPFVSLELDLFRGGEDDAHSLGVSVGRTKAIALLAATLSAATATAVAGQIAFLGLMVPHVMRLLVGPRHRDLLPLCLLGGAVFLLAADAGQRALFGDGRLQPGVLMSLIGGPFFVYLLVQKRRELGSW